MKTNFEKYQIKEDNSSKKFVVCFPSKERFAIKNNKLYTLICETVNLNK